MTDYVKSTNFASKDSLATGNPLKIVKGTEIDTEFNNIATAIDTKADIVSPTFTGTPAAPTATAGTNTTQIATTAFVTAADNLKVDKTTTITAGTGLSGGGDLSANRTVSLANTSVTAGSYGSSSAIPVITVNAQGQLTAASTASLVLSEIGVGQTWQDVKTSPGRSMNTTYTNSTGKPIMVAFGIGSSGAIVIVGGVTLYEFSSANGDTLTANTFIVPAGATYRINGGGLSYWAELR